MKTFKIVGTPREALGKKASKELRKKGLVPAVIYGNEPVELPYSGKLNPGEKMVEIEDNKGLLVTDIYVSFEGVRKLIYTPEIHLVEIDLKDGRIINAIIQELQFSPVADNLLHIDFLQVFGNKPIEMNVPVVLEGHAIGVKAGGKLNQTMRKLKVKGLADNIPEKLHINVDRLNLGQAIKVEQLHFEGIELISPKSAVVCMVKATRAAAQGAAEVEVAPEAEENKE